MPTVTISNLPLISDGHQFWVSAVDIAGNENTSNMSTTGLVTFPELVAPTLSGSTHIFTDYTEILTLPPLERNPVIAVFGETFNDLHAPLAVALVETYAEFFDHFEVQVDTVNTFDSGDEVTQNTGSFYNSVLGLHLSNVITFDTIYNTLYYVRVRVADGLGRVSAWSNIVSETAGDTVAPDEVGTANVDSTINGHTVVLTVDLSTYTQADDHSYYEWWLNTTSTHPGGNGIRETDVEFFFGNKSGQTLYAFVAAVDTNGNRSANYTTNVGNYPFVSSAFWVETGDVTDTSGDPIIDISNRGLEDENGNTVFDFTSGSGFNATLEGAIDFGAGGKLLLTDNTVAFEGTPIDGTEIIARGIKLYADADNYMIMEKTGTGAINVEIMGGTFRTGSSTSYLEIDSTGIKSYNASTQRVQILNDGSGWLGSASDFYWDSSGNVTIAGTVTVTNIEATTGTIAAFTIAANSLTSTNIGIHSAGYSEGAEILIGHATAYASAEIGFKADGSGKIASGNFSWDTSGNVTMAGTFTSTATITGGTVQTATSGARVVMNSSGIQGYDATTQRFNLDSDGSGWLGSASDFYWDSSGNVTIAGTVTVTNIAATTGTIAGWTIAANLISKTFDTDRTLNLSTTTNQESVYFYDPTTGTGDTRWVGMGTLYDGSSWTTETGIGMVVDVGATYEKYFWLSDQGAEIAGWEFTEDLFRSAASAERIELNAAKNRISIFDAVNEKVVMGYLEGLGRNKAWGTATGGSTTYLDDTGQDWEDDQLIGLDIDITSGTGSPQTRTITDNTATRITASFSPAVDGTSVYAVLYTSSNYGFWALDGDYLMIDGDITYESGDWIIHNDGSMKILDGSGNEIIRLGTDTGEKGLFIYNTSSVQLAKYISDEIYIGTAGNYLQYTVAGGLVVEGSITVTDYPAQPFDEDALLIYPLDAFPIDQSGNDNDANTTYGDSVTYVDGGVGGGYAALFPDGTTIDDYFRSSSNISLQEMTYTWWSKSSETTLNRVWQYQGSAYGAFYFNYTSGYPRLYLHNSNWRQWVDRSEQDDGEWHFWCIEIAGSAQSDIDNAKLYVDNEEVTVQSTTSSSAPNTTTVLRLGYDYDGYLQDFRVYDRILTGPERTALYTNPMNRSTTRITGDKIRTGTIESNNWSTTLGSQINLTDGTIYMGGSSSPKFSWNGSALAIEGSITITGGSGIASLTDAGDLAVLDTINATYVTDVDAYTTDQDRIGLNVMSVSYPDTPSGAGLYLSASNLGYYTGSSWTTYMGASGAFYLGGTSGELQWDGSTLLLGGDSRLTFGTRLVHGANLMAPDIRIWHETTTPATDDDMGYFTDGSNPYGGDDNNAIVNSINPWGMRDLIWECTATTGDVLDGGWGYNTFSIDKDLRYRYSGWLKQTGDSDGGFYYGCLTCSNLTADGSDSNNTNPYFRTNTDLPNVSYFNTTAITNGTMEADSSWTSYNSPTTNDRSAIQAHGGTYSRRIIVDGERQGIRSVVFTVDGYITYKLGIWLYGDGNEWSVYVDDNTERFYLKEFNSEILTLISGEWTHHVLHFQQKDRSTTARVYIVSAGNHTGTLYVDDVDLYTNNIVNGTFEENESVQTAFSGWAHTGTPTYCERSSTQARNGTYSWRITVNAANEGVQTSKIQIANGTTTATTTDKLVDSGASFDIDGTAVGDKIYNNTDNTCTTVTAIDSASTLSIANNIFAISEAYIISSDASYIKLVAGYQYRCIIWLYGNASAEWLAKISDSTNDYDFLETDNTTTLVPAASWTQYTLDFEAKANTDSAYIEIISNGTSGTLYIDDVTLQDTPWYLLVSFMHPDNYAGTESWGGIYHYKSGLRANFAVTDFKSQASTTANGYRLFYYNSSTITNQQYQYGPAMHVVDGSEPTVSAMLGNSMDIGWNIEGTTNISKYLISSPTIRGGDFAGGNYIQLDETGIHGFGSGVETFKVDASDGSVTIKSSDSGQRIEIDGSDNRLYFYDLSNNEMIRFGEDILGIQDGLAVYKTSMIFIDKASTGNEDDGYGLLVQSEYDAYNTETQAPLQALKDFTSASDFGGLYQSAITGTVRNNIASQINNLVGITGVAYIASGSMVGELIGCVLRSDDIGLRIATYSDYADYCDFSVDSSGILTIDPSGSYTTTPNSFRAAYDANTASYFGRAAIGYAGYSDYASFSHIDQNSTGNYCLLQQNDGSTYLNAPTGSAVNFRIDNVNVGDFDGTGFNVVGQYEMDGSAIINSSGQQTGNFKTRMSLVYGLSGSVTANDYMHGPGGVDVGEYRLAYDAVLTAITIRCNIGFDLSTSETLAISVQVADSDTDGSWVTVNNSLSLTSSDDGDYGAASTGQSTAFQAGNAVRIFLAFGGGGAPVITDPIVTLYFLSE